MSESLTPGPETLLAHVGFLRGLARALLRDLDQADDIVQETLLAAIERPPAPGNLRAWLGKVARNFALMRRREDSRRRAREQAVRPRHSAPSADEVAANLELQRQVVKAVSRLAEPGRGMLVLHFYEDLSVSEIARHYAVARKTVRTYLAEALGELRLELDRAHGGDRRAWSLGLLPLALAACPATAKAAAGAVSKASVGGSTLKAKLAVGVLTISVIGTGLVLWQTSRTDPPPTRNAQARYSSTSSVADPKEAEAADSATPPASARTKPRATHASAEPPPPGFVTGRVRLAGDGPVAGVSVALRGPEPGEDTATLTPARVTQTLASGEFRFEGLGWGRYEIEAAHPGYAPHEFCFDLTESKGAGPHDILLTTGGNLRIRVLGPWGTPVADEHIVVLARRTGRPRKVVCQGSTNHDGSLLVEHLPPMTYVIQRTASIEGEPDSAVAVTRSDLADKPDGKAAKAVTETRLKEDGSVVVKRTVGREIKSGTADPSGIGRSEAGAGTVIVRQPELGPLRTATVLPGKTVEVVFEVSCGLTGSLAGPDGQPLANAIVTLEPAPDGEEGYRSVSTRTDKDGRFETRRFPAGEYELFVLVGGERAYRVSMGRLLLRVGQVMDVPLRIEGATLSGCITEAGTGEPVGRAQLLATPIELRDDEVVQNLGPTVYAVADARGRYTFGGLVPGFHKILVLAPHPRFRDGARIVEVARASRLRDVDFALEVRRFGRLRLRVLGPEGHPATGLTFAQLRKAGGEITEARDLHGKEVGDGVFEFLLEHGEQTIAVFRKGCRADPVTVTIVQDETAECTIQFRALGED